MLEGRAVLLGVTGGIAAYKSAELARLLVKEGSSVQVIMTDSAKCFISPLTFKALTQRPVYTSLFDSMDRSATAHIELSREPEAVIVAPATANILGKYAAGIADDLLSTVLMAVDHSRCPVLVAPSMNNFMFNSPAVQENLDILRRRGVIIADPSEGELACGEVGQGRMPEPASLVDFIKKHLSKKNDFEGFTFLVTAGPTREALDPIRFLSNFSSGRMGYSLAQVAAERGAEVILVSGPTSLTPPAGVQFYPVTSAQEMYDAVMDISINADIIIKAAAVCDYKPVEMKEQKIKKSNSFSINFERNPDILEDLGRVKRSKHFIVGFAAETESLSKNAQEKLKKKNADLIVANDLKREGAGFECETNIVQLIFKDGYSEELPLMTKYELSHYILDLIKSRISSDKA